MTSNIFGDVEHVTLAINQKLQKLFTWKAILPLVWQELLGEFEVGGGQVSGCRKPLPELWSPGQVQPQHSAGVRIPGLAYIFTPCLP